MNVSELARRTNVPAQRLRHYESLGLILAARSKSGYREFAERSVRDVLFIVKSREVGVSLKDIGEVLPRYRSGTLTFDEMIELMGTRIVEVDQQIEAQRDIRKKLVSAMRWFKKRKREFAKREKNQQRSPWPSTRMPSK
jgi:MerR family transcriptional regulator, copper efflux regulator